MPQTLLAVDTLDDRREIHTLLAKLPPPKRVAFLGWCCRLCARPNRSCPVPMPDPGLLADAGRSERADDRLTASVYYDVVTLGVQWDLDMPAAARALEQFVRRGALPPLPHPG